jgi:hypothetical protein
MVQLFDRIGNHTTARERQEDGRTSNWVHFTSTYYDTGGMFISKEGFIDFHYKK